MKKNLRIASATAAALLAVAPVVASAATANADVTVNGATESKPSTTDPKADGTVTVNVSLTASDGTSVADAVKSVKVTVNGASFDASKVLDTDNANANVRIVNADGSTINGTNGAEPTLQAGHKYAVEIDNFVVTGLTTGNSYAIAGGKLAAAADEPANATTTSFYSASALKQGSKFTSDSFQVYNQKATGSVSFTEKSSTKGGNPTIVSNGSIDLGSINTVADLVSAINDKYAPAVTNGNATVTAFDNMNKAVEDALKNAGIKVDASTGTFSQPASSFPITLSATASNGNSAKFTVTVKNARSDKPKASSAPTFAKSGTALTSNSDSMSVASVNPTPAVTANSIAANYTASYKDGDNTYNAPVSVKSSNLNTAVVGKYQVVLTATNSITGKSADLTVNVTVGNPDSIKTVEAGNDTASIYTIDGNNVTKTDNSLKNGAKVATYGSVNVNGTSYTRINSKDSTQFVETKYVDGSVKPSDEKTTTKKVMYKSAVYNKDGETTGKHIAGYTNTKFAVDKDGNLIKKTLKGGEFYKLAGKDEYVRVRNVTGSTMTLKHNAYAYKSNGKRANRVLYKKGHKITVYGGQYKAIRHYRKNAVRIGVNKYIKVVNVNYKLAD